MLWIFRSVLTILAETGLFLFLNLLVLRKGIAVKNKVIVKDKDEWSSLANFIGNMIAKYADEIDFDSLPNPDVYLQKRYIYESYKAYMKFRNKKMK